MHKAQDDDLVMTLVDSALAKPPTERESFLREACSHDPDLFKQAWSYVEWEQRMQGFLEAPLFAALSVEHPFQEGDVLDGRFRIEREIAQGGMGLVYVAWDQKLDRRIALKCAKTGFRKRLPPEVRHAREIAHHNVCKIFDIHVAQTSAGEIHFVTMEYLEGETLADRLKRGPLPDAEARPIARQLCAGLAAAHHEGVVHGDLKSNNVILTKCADASTRAVITDFGMARAMETPQRTEQSGPRGGTPDYMAPELLKGEKASIASDIYALGVLLHELASGRKPAREGLAAVHPKWDPILAKCLAGDPADRYATAAEVVRAFEPSATRRWFLIAAAAVLVAAATGVVTYERATAPKEVVRLAMIPFTYSADLAPVAEGVFRETSANLAKLTGGTRARYSAVSLAEAQRAQVDTPEKAKAKFEATHVLRGTLTTEKDHAVLHAFLTDTRTGVNAKDWKMEYAPGEVRYIPVALAGIVTATLHLPPVAVAPINAAAQADYDSGSALLRRTATYDAAIAAFERAVVADPDSALAYAGLAEAQWAKQSLAYITKNNEWLSQAMGNISQAQRRNPDLPRVWMVAGTLDVTNSFFERGTSEYMRAIEIDPNYSDAHRNLGRIYEITGQKEQALAEYRKAVDTDPGYYRAYQYLGVHFYLQYKLKDALDPLQRAAALAPDEPEPRLYLADAYKQLGRFQEAETELRVALAKREIPKVLRIFAETLIYEGRDRDALAPLLRAVSLSPQDYYVWRLLGVCYQHLGLGKDAEQAYRNGLKAAEESMGVNPRYAWPRANVGFLHAALGERTQAKSEIAQAEALSVDGNEVQFTLVATYEALGERTDALRVLAGARPELLADLSRWPDFAGLRADPRFVQLLASNHVQ